MLEQVADAPAILRNISEEELFVTKSFSCQLFVGKQFYSGADRSTFQCTGR